MSALSLADLLKARADWLDVYVVPSADHDSEDVVLRIDGSYRRDATIAPRMADHFAAELQAAGINAKRAPERDQFAGCHCRVPALSPRGGRQPSVCQWCQRERRAEP
ncbi:MAG TPA: hypothetical protein VHF88_07710 [Thermoleophilaceae bacterium]|nr:hypothetical protein [Thermoleophilaceae bacterium]